MALPASDSFTGADGSGLSANWTTIQGSFLVYSNSLRAASNNLEAMAWWDADAFSADQWCEWTYIYAGSPVSAVIGGALRVSTSGVFTGYVAYGHQDGLYIAKNIAWSQTSIQDLPAPANGDVIYFQAVGSTLTLKINGATQWSGTDTSIASGAAGIANYSATTGITGLRIDDWSAGNVTAAGGPVLVTPRMPLAILAR